MTEIFNLLGGGLAEDPRVRDDEHLVNACDYVLDNAVRAGLCATRDDWPWLGGELVDGLR